MTARLLQRPASEPVTLDDAKWSCRIMPDDTTHDQALLSRLIPAAREQAEGRMRRALISQRWRSTKTSFGICVPLEMPNLISVETVKYIDTGYVLQTLAADQYTVDTESQPGALYASPLAGVWPSTGISPAAVSIDYTCGYGEPSDVPASIKTWICALVAHWFENGMAAQALPGLTASVPTSFLDELIAPYIVHHVGNA